MSTTTSYKPLARCRRCNNDLPRPAVRRGFHRSLEVPRRADGGNSLVAEHLGLKFDGKMGVGGSMNILFRADLSKYVAHRPSVLYWVMQPGADVGGIGMGLIRMVRPWNEWLIVWGYDINQPPPSVTAELATEIARQLVGDPELEIELLAPIPGPSTTASPPRCRRVEYSSWAMPPIGTPPQMDWARTPRSRTGSISPGSSPRSSRGRPVPGSWTAIHPSARQSPARS